MNATVTKISAIVLFLFVEIALLSMPVCGQGGGFTIAPIVKRLEPSPDGGHFFNCDDCEGRINGYHAFNNRGDVGLAADTEGSCFEGRFLFTGENSILLANDCQQTVWGKFNLLGTVNINNAGQAAFIAGPLNETGIVPMILLYGDGQTTKVVAEGDATPVGTIFRRCSFSAPSINDSGEIAFGACNDDGQGKFLDGVFKYSNGQIQPVVTSTEPSPIGGQLSMNFIPAVNAIINNKGEVLFDAGVIFGPTIKEKFGWFLKTQAGIRKIEVDTDPLTDGLFVELGSLGNSDLNDKSEVAFSVLLSGKSDSGIFVNSDDKIAKIMAEGEPTPIGGKFATLNDPDLIENFLLGRPRINANSAVAFKAKVIDGSSRLGIFLASPNAMLKVVAVGDKIPTGETIKEIDTFALNDNGEVAFFAYGRKGHELPLGVFKATPATPIIKSVKLKRKKGALELRVAGDGFITNDTVIEINGVVLDSLSYPEDFREDGGTTQQIRSRDARLEQLLVQGQQVHITVFNSLTNRRSEAKDFTR